MGGRRSDRRDDHQGVAVVVQARPHVGDGVRPGPHLVEQGRDLIGGRAGQRIGGHELAGGPRRDGLPGDAVTEGVQDADLRVVRASVSTDRQTDGDGRGGAVGGGGAFG
ncbi:MAG: hypothetical protein QG608_1971 [Actinomycetota bacterium]|nr:hypothetical protein [Actinomycetota bacterium]